MGRIAGTYAMVMASLLIAGAAPALAVQAQHTSPRAVAYTGTEKEGPAIADQSETPKPTLERRGRRYRLESGDILQFDFPLSPEISETVTVAPDGYITLRAAGDLYVEGLTLPGLRQAIRNAYSKTLHQPIISVTLKDFQKPFFTVGGQVGRPGKYDLRGDTSVLEALEIAGGVTDSAKHSQVLLFRRVSNDWVEVRKINVKQMLRGRDLAEDVDLQSGDMLLVPKNTISKIARFIPVPSLGMYMNQL